MQFASFSSIAIEAENSIDDWSFIHFLPYIFQFGHWNCRCFAANFKYRSQESNFINIALQWEIAATVSIFRIYSA